MRREHLGIGVQLLALLGAWRLSMLSYDERWMRTEYVAFGLAFGSLAVAAVAARLAWWWLAVGLALLAAVDLTVAAGASLVRVLGQSDVVGLWATGRASGWVLCLLIAAAVASAGAVPMAARVAAASLVVGGTAVLLLRPIQGAGYDAVLVGIVGSFAALAIASLVLRNPWRRAVRLAAVPIGLAGAWLVGPSVLAVVESVMLPLLGFLGPDPAGEPRGAILVHGIGSPVVVGVALAVLLAGIEIVVTRQVPGRGLVIAMVAAGCVVAVLRYAVPPAVVVTVLASFAVVVVLAMLVGPHRSRLAG